MTAGSCGSRCSSQTLTSEKKQVPCFKKLEKTTESTRKPEFFDENVHVFIAEVLQLKTETAEVAVEIQVLKGVEIAVILRVSTY